MKLGSSWHLARLRQGMHKGFSSRLVFNSGCMLGEALCPTPHDACSVLSTSDPIACSAALKSLKLQGRKAQPKLPDQVDWYTAGLNIQNPSLNCREAVEVGVQQPGAEAFPSAAGLSVLLPPRVVSEFCTVAACSRTGRLLFVIWKLELSQCLRSPPCWSLAGEPSGETAGPDILQHENSGSFAAVWQALRPEPAGILVPADRTAAWTGVSFGTCRHRLSG